MQTRLFRLGLLVLLGLRAFDFEAVHAAPRVVVEDEIQSQFARAQSRPAQRGIEFPPATARFVRLIIHRSSSGEPGIDELELFGPDSELNLGLAQGGALATASSVIAGYPIHAIDHLNDGRYGNDWSWIAASAGVEWVQLVQPEPARISRVWITRDRLGQFRDRIPLDVEVRLSLDGQAWESVARHLGAPADDALEGFTLPASLLPRPTWDGALEYAFLRERETWRRLPADDHLSPLRVDRPATPGGRPYWGRIARLDPLERVLVLFEEMIDRLSAQGLNVNTERTELGLLRSRAAEAGATATADALYLAAREAKRRLFFRDPQLAPLERVLFAKRHPLKPSHNYSDHFDSLFLSGGGICILHIPRDREGRLAPARAELEPIFDGSHGIVRHPVADFDAQTIYFAFRPEVPEVDGWNAYWQLRSVRVDGSDPRKLTDGPFHDFDPVPLPDGDLGFMSTRCKARFLCWRPQAYVLHRMTPGGTDPQRLSFANLSEWDPSMMRDGRILWTRSEYQDKGADFGHTLWAIRPDGSQAELVFGNNTPNCYGHAREVPGTRELVCTLISHGDHQGPIALIDLSHGPFAPEAITNITPDTRPQYQMDRSYAETFRDPSPVSSDHFLVSHNPGTRDHWALYVIDRYGNRELLYLDPAISSKRPAVLRPRPRPPILPSVLDPDLAREGLGQFIVQDVYQGLEPAVTRGRARYLRVVQEVPADLELLACGEYRNDHPPFEDFYATPVHRVAGPRQNYRTRTPNAPEPRPRAADVQPTHDEQFEVVERHGWPSYVAKAPLGTVPIASDGSASLLVPAGKVLYFQLLDADYSELQRMRSVVQLQPGERRSCIGCHEGRTSSPTPRLDQITRASAQRLEPPPWGAGPFDYQRTVQPVLDAHCVRCHDGKAGQGFNLGGQRDRERVPASYRSLIQGGWVHYFDWVYGARHYKAEPLTFGSLRSRLWEVLADAQHTEVRLADHETRAVKTWIDLNCPLWPDYQYRLDRPE
ncbi:MAG: hypothetical protein KJ072_03825 [Verrucomicrobia bacterium]|nr:hypothetical protein [Verrucomicrobiota bacterium]